MSDQPYKANCNRCKGNGYLIKTGRNLGGPESATWLDGCPDCEGKKKALVPAIEAVAAAHHERNRDLFDAASDWGKPWADVPPSRRRAMVASFSADEELIQTIEAATAPLVAELEEESGKVGNALIEREEWRGRAVEQEELVEAYERKAAEVRGIASEQAKRPIPRGIREQFTAIAATLQSSDTGEGEPIPRDYWREVPCGHPPDPVAMFGRGGEPVCHCGCILDQQDGVHVELAPGPIVHCQNCGCGVAIPETTDKEGGDEK